MRFFILFSLLIVNMLAASIDNDMDGVDNDMDQCPNTPFFELVDKRGCSIQKIPVKEEYHFDIILGGGYVETGNGTSDTLVSFMADYYYKNFIVTLFTQSYSQNNTYAGNDLYLYTNYKLKIDDFTVKVGPGMVLPIASDSNNKTDYFFNINMNYKIDKYDINLYYKYIFMHDDLTQDIDTKAISMGYYLLDTTYINLAYSKERSIYETIEDVENVTLMLNQALDRNWFVNLRVSHGLSESASDLSAIVSLGYYF